MGVVSALFSGAPLVATNEATHTNDQLYAVRICGFL